MEDRDEGDENSEDNETDLGAPTDQMETAKSSDEEERNIEALRDEVIEGLSPREKEMFEAARPAIRNSGAQRPITFSHEAAKRWVYQRVFEEYGWTSERFRGFEQALQRQLPGRQASRVERVSKKYQWLAYFELLARLADNVYLAGHSWEDWRDVEYRGPWQEFFRDIDPSVLVRASDDHPDHGYPDAVWWRPIDRSIPGPTLEERREALWNEDFVPDLEDLVIVDDPDGTRWAVLRNHISWRDGVSRHSEEARPQWDFWVRIRSLIVNQEVAEKLLTTLGGTDRRDPHEISDDLEVEMFAGEYPWHPSTPRDSTGWREISLTIDGDERARFEAIVPLYSHSRRRERDFSGNEHIQTFHPDPFLIEEMNLQWEGGGACAYSNDEGRQIYDPSLHEPGPSAGLCRLGSLASLTEAEDVNVLWVVAGEKGLYGAGMGASGFYGRQVLGGVFVLSDTGIRGSSWLAEERPHGKDG